MPIIMTSKKSRSNTIDGSEIRRPGSRNSQNDELAVPSRNAIIVNKSVITDHLKALLRVSRLLRICTEVERKGIKVLPIYFTQFTCIYFWTFIS